MKLSKNHKLVFLGIFIFSGLLLIGHINWNSNAQNQDQPSKIYYLFSQEQLDQRVQYTHDNHRPSRHFFVNGDEFTMVSSDTITKYKDIKVTLACNEIDTVYVNQLNQQDYEEWMATNDSWKQFIKKKSLPDDVPTTTQRK